MLTVFTVFLAGCGGDNAPSDDGAASAGKGSSTASAEAASTEAPKDEVKKKPVAPETAIAKKVALTILGERSSVLAKEGEPLASLLDSIDDATSDEELQLLLEESRQAVRESEESSPLSELGKVEDPVGHLKTQDQRRELDLLLENLLKFMADPKRKDGGAEKVLAGMIRWKMKMTPSEIEMVLEQSLKNAAEAGSLKEFKILLVLALAQIQEIKAFAEESPETTTAHEQLAISAVEAIVSYLVRNVYYVQDVEGSQKSLDTPRQSLQAIRAQKISYLVNTISSSGSAYRGQGGEYFFFRHRERYKGLEASTGHALTSFCESRRTKGLPAPPEQTPVDDVPQQQDEDALVPFAAAAFARFSLRADNDALDCLRAHAIAGDAGAKEILDSMHWSPLLGRPALAIRWGVGVNGTVNSKAGVPPPLVDHQAQQIFLRVSDGNTMLGSRFASRQAAYDWFKSYSLSKDISIEHLASVGGRIGAGGWSEELRFDRFGRMSDRPRGRTLFPDTPPAYPGFVGAPRRSLKFSGFVLKEIKAGTRNWPGAVATVGEDVLQRIQAEYFSWLQRDAFPHVTADALPIDTKIMGASPVQILPGVRWLGLGSREECLENAQTEGCDLLGFVSIEVKEISPNGLVSVEASLEIVNVGSGESLFTTAPMSLHREGRRGSDAIHDELDRLVRFVDSGALLSEWPPAFQREHVMNRAAVLASGDKDKLLASLAELWVYHSRGLLSEEDLIEVVGPLLDKDQAETLVRGTPEERARILMPLCPSASRVKNFLRHRNVSNVWPPIVNGNRLALDPATNGRPIERESFLAAGFERPMPGETPDGEMPAAPGAGEAGANQDLGETRTWTDRDGKTVVAKFVRVHEAAVILKSGTRVLRIPFDGFSAADQELLRKHGHTPK